MPTWTACQDAGALAGTLPKDWGSGGSLQAPTTDPLLLGFDNTGISGPLPDSWSQQLPGFGGLISSNTGLTGMSSVVHKALQAGGRLRRLRVYGFLKCSSK